MPAHPSSSVKLDLQHSFANYYKQTAKLRAHERGVLLVEGDEWKVHKINPDQISKQDDVLLKNTLRKVLELDPSKLAPPHLINWIEAFNATLTLLEFKKKTIQPIAREVKVVQFSSMSPNFAWLSNFFPSIIYDHDNNIIYPSVESGYVAFKARQSGESLDVIKTCARTINPKEVKQKGSSFWVEGVDPANTAIKLNEMARLFALKFQQNPILAQWLRGSIASLEENTSDSFWGTACGQVKTPESNQLGKIAERFRQTLILE